MPAFLRTHYQQYKRDTAQLSTWLVKTATSFGYPVTSLSPSTQSYNEEEDVRTAAQIRNAKKNARKKAKAKAKKDGGDQGEGEIAGASAAEVGEGEGQEHGTSASPTATAAATGSYELKVAQYLELARYVLGKGLEIPVEVLRLLRRCISLRQRALARFATIDDPANERHRYFVNALREVLNLFTDSLKQSSATDSDVSSAANRFADLAVDDDEDPEDLADIQLPGVSTSESIRATVAITTEEAVLNVITFLQDVESIRTYIDGLWKDYKAGTVDLVTAAVTTNTALELLQEPHHDLMERVLPAFQGDINKMILVIVLALKGMGTGVLYLDIPQFPDVHPADFLTAGVYDFTMFPLVQILGGLADLLTEDAIPTYKAGHYGYYDPTEIVRRNDFSTRWDIYQILLAESFTDLFFLVELGDMDRRKPATSSGPQESSPHNTFFLDELVRLFAVFVKTKQWNFMLLAAFQIFLDINLIMGDRTTDGVKQMRGTAAHMVKTLDRRRAMEGGSRPPTWESDNEILIKMFYHYTTYWRDFDFRALATKIPGLDGAGAKFMERNPTLCGLILFRLYINYQDIGFALSNTWNSILSCAHLNNACRFKVAPGEASLPVWTDMNLVIDIHGSDNAFDGSIPTNLDEAQSSYLRMAGYPRPTVEAFERFGIEGEEVSARLLDVMRVENVRAPETLRDRTTILPVFKRKFIADAATGLQYDIKTIETLLSNIQNRQQQATTASDTVSPDSQGRPTKGKGKPKGPTKRKLRRERKHRAPKFSVVQLLAVLEESLVSEIRSIRFDYVSMHIRCLELLKSTHRISREYLDRKLGRSCINEIWEMPNVVPLILHFAAMSARASQLYLGMDRRGEMVHSRLLMGATAQMRALLTKSGERDKETKSVETGHSL